MVKKLLFLLLLIIQFKGWSQNVFFDEYPEAKQEVLDYYGLQSALHNCESCDPDFVFSIVAPEVAMYNGYFDGIETTTAEIFYTSFGKEYGNFSLGLFQMKPSFIEELELDYPLHCITCIYKDSIVYDESLTESEIRAERVERLKYPNWQQTYLLVFNEIMDQLYGQEFEDVNDKLSFYASAYNYGYQSPKSEIIDWQRKKSFPGRTEVPIISYAELAKEFYQLLKNPENEEEASKSKKKSELLYYLLIAGFFVVLFLMYLLVRKKGPDNII